MRWVDVRIATLLRPRRRPTPEARPVTADPAEVPATADATVAYVADDVDSAPQASVSRAERSSAAEGSSAARPGISRLAGAAALIAVLTIASRLLGFVRTLVLGKVAIGPLATAYLTANAIPNIVF